MKEVKARYFINKGWLEIKLSTKVLTYLNKLIKNKKENYNKDLAGNIDESYVLKDENHLFFNTVLVDCIMEYIKEFKEKGSVPNILTQECKYTLSNMWVNYQKKHEFNPLHNHAGVFSFVIWMHIPSSYKEESSLKFVKHANHKPVASFEFIAVNMLGHITSHIYHLGPQYEGTMLFFPSQLHHQVYPFYTSNEKRITISGNIKLNSEQSISKTTEKVEDK